MDSWDLCEILAREAVCSPIVLMRKLRSKDGGHFAPDHPACKGRSCLEVRLCNSRDRAHLDNGIFHPNTWNFVGIHKRIIRVLSSKN